MGAEILMEKDVDSLKSRNKPMVVKLNSEQLDDYIQRFSNIGEFFCLTFNIHDVKTVTLKFGYISSEDSIEV
ncbi:hypothetical protein [Peribacillus frigoritolerans]|uniref:hypothetical protein n=1 Tax=Peribacillus castrilensis TaxID=2897690 RepID=UPI003DA2660B